MQQWLITGPSELVAGTGVRIVGAPLLSGSDTHTGWTAGFGFEQAFTERISTRIEYPHIDLGSETQNLKFTGGTLPAIPDKVDVRMDTIRLGVNVKLTNGTIRPRKTRAGVARHSPAWRYLTDVEKRGSPEAATLVASRPRLRRCLLR
jgi:hypothetical protein